jgi:hypothetical protein
VIQFLLKLGREDQTYRELVMAERRPIFVNKGSLPQIGYVEDNEAFDLSGSRRCIYHAETGNLCDFDTGKIVGHVSLQGFFLGASWIADELFGQRAPVKDDLPVTTEKPKGSLSEERSPATARQHAADDSEAAAPEEPESVLLDRAIGMIRSVISKGRS